MLTTHFNSSDYYYYLHLDIFNFWQERTTIRHSDSDSDLCLNDNDDYRMNGSDSIGGGINNNTVDSRVRRSSNGRVSIRLVSDERSTILATYKNIDH